VIPLAKHLAGTTGRVEKVKNVLSVDRVRKKDGRRFYIIICINAMQLQVQFISHFSSYQGFHFHTCIPFTSPRFQCINHRARHVRDVTPACAASRIKRSSGAVWRRQLPSAYYWHSLPTKWVEKVGKVKYCGPIHTLQSLPDHGGDVCKVWFRSVQKCGFV